MEKNFNIEIIKTRAIRHKTYEASWGLKKKFKFKNFLFSENYVFQESRFLMFSSIVIYKHINIFSWYCCTLFFYIMSQFNFYLRIQSWVLIYDNPKISITIWNLNHSNYNVITSHHISIGRKQHQNKRIWIQRGKHNLEVVIFRKWDLFLKTAFEIVRSCGSISHIRVYLDPV